MYASRISNTDGRHDVIIYDRERGYKYPIKILNLEQADDLLHSLKKALDARSYLTVKSDRNIVVIESAKGV